MINEKIKIERFDDKFHELTLDHGEGMLEKVYLTLDQIEDLELALIDKLQALYKYRKSVRNEQNDD